MDFNDRRESCSVCDATPGSNEEWGGVSGARGCPACGATLSPTVRTSGKRILHNGAPVSIPSVGEGASFIQPKPEGGYRAGHHLDYSGRDIVFAEGRTAKAAAIAAAHAAAEKAGKKFVQRTPEQIKRINELGKDYSGRDWTPIR